MPIILLLVGLIGCSDQSSPQQEKKTGQQAPPTGRPEWMAAPEKIPQPKPTPVVEEERALLVGVIGPETGEESAYGRQILAGVEQSARDVNARGGIHGLPIKIAHFDDGGNPATVEQAVKTLLQQRAVAIIAAPTGWSTFAPVHLINESKTIFIAVGSRRNIGRSGPFIFHFALPEATAVDGLLHYVVDTSGATHFALVTSSAQDNSLTLSSQFKQTVGKLPGGEIVLETDAYDSFSGQQDLTKVVKALQAAAKTYQAVIFTGGAEEGAELAKALRDSGLHHPLLGGEDLFMPEFLQIGGKAVAGTLLYASHSPEKKGGVPDRFAALAYDAFSLLAQAIQKVDTLKPSLVREALLTNNEVDGMTGRSGFTPQGEPKKQPFLYQVTVDAGGSHFVLIEKPIRE